MKSCRVSVKQTQLKDSKGEERTAGMKRTDMEGMKRWRRGKRKRKGAMNEPHKPYRRETW